MTAAPAPRPVPRRALETAVIRAWPDRRAAARAIVDLWRDALPPPSGLSLTDARARLALVLAHPRARFEGAPADAGTAAFQRWGTVLEGVDDARASALWPAVTGADFSVWRAMAWNRLLRTGEGAPADLARALRQNLDPDDLTGLLRGGRLRAWLDARDALAATGLPAQVSDADWLRTFFVRERRWGPDLLLALLGAARDAADRAVAVEALGGPWAAGRPRCRTPSPPGARRPRRGRR
ncbi:MAG: hypothetical protein H6704_20385 [Myxococcales bacterium]|nr:hypothetical protein [Myxococcales bacterium]